MPQLHDFPKPRVPREIAAQIRSYLRVQWPTLDARDGALWNVPANSPARTFVVLDGDLVVSHAEANFRTVEHAGEPFRVGGISGVFTYPAWRGGGHARRVVAAATHFLDHSDADLAILFCGEPLRRLYTACGWEAIETAHLLHGDPIAPARHAENLVMMRFISLRGRTARAAFASERIYVGDRTW